jgi:hypothetical protein
MRLILVLALFAIAMLAPASASGANNGEVSAQVTVASPCVTVGNNINYGTLAFSTTTPFVQVSKSGTTSYTNCSVTAERIYVRGTTATSNTSDAVWDRLTGTNTCNVGPNIYGHSVQDGTTGLWLSLTDQELNAAAAAGVTRTVNTGLSMPCSGSDGAGETMNFSIVVTASF